MGMRSLCMDFKKGHRIGLGLDMYSDLVSPGLHCPSPIPHPRNGGVLIVALAFLQFTPANTDDSLSLRIDYGDSFLEMPLLRSP